MFKSIAKEVWAFDAEWIPDPVAGQLLYNLSPDLSNREIMEEMWKLNGATEENPTPFLKTVMSRLVSISAVVRKHDRNGVSLKLLSLPRDTSKPEELKESSIIEKFLSGIGKQKPQIVGYNSTASDVLILIQRAILNGLSCPGFAKRPEKPWEGFDYFDSRNSEAHIDMKNILSSWGKGTPSLNELTVLSGIPGKIDVDGNQVAEMWLNGQIADIVAYNEFDALSTYLLWLRMALFGGFFDHDEYAREVDLTKQLVIDLSAEPGREHLGKYLEHWQNLEEKWQTLHSS